MRDKLEHITLEQEIKSHMDSLWFERLFECHKKCETTRVGKALPGQQQRHCC